MTYLGRACLIDVVWTCKTSTNKWSGQATVKEVSAKWVEHFVPDRASSVALRTGVSRRSGVGIDRPGRSGSARTDIQKGLHGDETILDLYTAGRGRSLTRHVHFTPREVALAGAIEHIEDLVRRYSMLKVAHSRLQVTSGRVHRKLCRPKTWSKTCLRIG